MKLFYINLENQILSKEVLNDSCFIKEPNFILGVFQDDDQKTDLSDLATLTTQFNEAEIMFYKGFINEVPNEINFHSGNRFLNLPFVPVNDGGFIPQNNTALR
jgi:hypothetical protein